ncbi:hypothetical protein, partial [Hyphomicrobium sulfonivorans]|uniref:hypothetical protein n=1 Tax=Hyphomicrobium sulfonivorans TaxID=121290 RepID=UPI000AF8BD65
MNIQEPIVIVHLAHGNFSHIDCVGVPLARVVVACDGVPERFAATRQLTAEADIAAAVAAYNAA